VKLHRRKLLFNFYLTGIIYQALSSETLQLHLEAHNFAESITYLQKKLPNPSSI